MPFEPHRSSSTPVARLGSRASARIGLRGAVPAGTGTSDLEKCRSWSVQIPMRSTTHALLPRVRVRRRVARMSRAVVSIVAFAQTTSNAAVGVHLMREFLSDSGASNDSRRTRIWVKALLVRKFTRDISSALE